MTETPTLYDWAGGMPALDRLTDVFYRHVHADPVLAPVFAHVGDDHPHHVAVWLAEVFGGPAAYTDEHGGYPAMLEHHRGLRDHRRAADPMGDAHRRVRPTRPGCRLDPEFRSAFVAYVEWGSRIGLANSQPGSTPPPRAPVPHWGWGEAPPYQP